MTQLRFSRSELLADHVYARPHEVAGYRLHGGFDACGHYVSPRTLHRWPAIRAWSQALTSRGHALVESSQQLMVRPHYPNAEQQKYLLQLGLGQTLWDSLTVTGFVEARGRRLAAARAPDFQPVIVEDISDMAIGHLNEGLLAAHGLDEGGDPERGEGGHDAMWFAVRDMLFGANAFPVGAVPESLARPEMQRLIPQLPPEHENWILLLMNILMIEIRAEKHFAFCTAVMRDPGNFPDRRAEAVLAAELVDRIRQDEASHVGYLTVVISELRSATFRTVNGRCVPGAQIIDPVWAGMIRWHAVTHADFDREQTRKMLAKALSQSSGGRERLDRFEALGDPATARECAA